MAEQNDEFARKLRATFKVEAEEHLQAMSSMLLDLEKSPESAVAAGKIEQIYREAHSLKGAARAVDQYDVEAICQALESVFAGWKRGTTAPSPEEFDVFHDSLDTIRTLLAAPAQAGEGGRQKHADLLQRLKQVGAKKPSGGDRPAAPIQVSQPEVASRDPFSQPEAASRTPSMDPVITDRAVAIPETVRISTAKLDARLLQAEELLTAKASLAQRAAELRELAGSFDQWRKEWTRVSADVRVMRRQLEDRASSESDRSTHASTALMEFLDWNGDYLRSIESRITNLSSSAEQDRRGIGKQVDELLEESKKLLMLPFSDLAAILPKVVRDLARDQGKDVDLVVRGGEIEIDKRILEEIKDPLIHILRNSVDHGIEKPAERIRGQKPARATITLTASRVNGSKVEIEVADDGAGIDLERVKESAIRHGILAPQAARGLSDAEAIALIFRSEITTSPIVTEISGRGLGMTIVRANTEKLGGSVSVQSSRHKGTTLQMVLPITVATFRGVLVSSAGQVFVVPTTHIERVLRVKRDQIHTVENREAISLNGRLVSLARLDRVLEIPPKPDSAADSSAVSVMVLHADDERLAFAVDQVLREEEVLVKPLRKPLVRVRNIAGATVLGSGKAVAVLQVSDLIKSARMGGAAAPTPIVPATDSSAPSKRVLVVEDSITSRMLLKGILESAGYEVRTAVDGMEAFTILREDQFDLVVSDVEMPRLNGFDLTARIRADIRLSEMPVILVTALESREERERGIDAGANAYIIKSSFDQSNLLEVARSLA